MESMGFCTGHDKKKLAKNLKECSQKGLHYLAPTLKTFFFYNITCLAYFSNNNILADMSHSGENEMSDLKK